MQDAFPMLQHEVVLLEQRKQKCGQSVEMGEEHVLRIETDRLYIRQLTEEDRDLLSLIWIERCPTLLDLSDGNKETREKFLRDLWETTQDPALLTGTIFLRDGGRFCGRINMQKIDQEVPEVGIDILAAYQNQGYGPEAIVGFANWFGENRHVSKIKVLIAAGNTHSSHVFKKLGAEYVQDNLSFFKAVKELAESFPEKQESIMRDLKVREYILKLPVSYP